MNLIRTCILITVLVLLVFDFISDHKKVKLAKENGKEVVTRIQNEVNHLRELIKENHKNSFNSRDLIKRRMVENKERIDKLSAHQNKQDDKIIKFDKEVFSIMKGLDEVKNSNHKILKEIKTGIAVKIKELPKREVKKKPVSRKGSRRAVQL